MGAPKNYSHITVDDIKNNIKYHVSLEDRLHLSTVYSLVESNSAAWAVPTSADFLYLSGEVSGNTQDIIALSGSTHSGGGIYKFTKYVNQGESIQAAIDDLWTNNNLAPGEQEALVVVGPGVFTENLTLKPFVHVISLTTGFNTFSTRIIGYVTIANNTLYNGSGVQRRFTLMGLVLRQPNDASTPLINFTGTDNNKLYISHCNLTTSLGSPTNTNLILANNTHTNSEIRLFNVGSTASTISTPTTTPAFEIRETTQVIVKGDSFLNMGNMAGTINAIELYDNAQFYFNNSTLVGRIEVNDSALFTAMDANMTYAGGTQSILSLNNLTSIAALHNCIIQMQIGATSYVVEGVGVFTHGVLEYVGTVDEPYAPSLILDVGVPMVDGAEVIKYRPKDTDWDVNTVKKGLDSLRGLTANTSITIPSGSTREQIQTIINNAPHKLNGYDLRFIFEDGTYELDKPLVFYGFVGGYLRIYGNSSQGNGVENKNVVIKTVDSGWDASSSHDDVDGLNGMFIFYRCDKATVRYINFNNMNGAIRNIDVSGIILKSGSRVNILYNSFTANVTRAYTAIIAIEDGYAWVYHNFIGGWQYAFYPFTCACIMATGNTPTTVGTSTNVHISRVSDGAYIDYADDNSLTCTAKAKERSNGFYVQDIYDGSNTTYEASFVDGDLSSGVLTVTHNLNEQFVDVQVVDDNNKLIQPDDITFSSTTALNIDLSSFTPLNGTWNLKIRR